MKAWIIDQLEQEEEVERPFLELEYPVPVVKEEVQSEGERGVIVIEIYNEEDEED